MRNFSISYSVFYRLQTSISTDLFQKKVKAIWILWFYNYEMICSVQLFSKRHILDSSKLIEFADDNF